MPEGLPIESLELAGEEWIAGELIAGKLDAGEFLGGELVGGELVGEELVWCEPVARKLSRALGARPLILGSYGIALSAASELNWRERFLRPKSESIIAANDPSTEWRYGG